MHKKILFIKNFKNSKINLLDTITFMESYDLIDYSQSEIIDLLKFFDIIIIGGGLQHLYDIEQVKELHPEIIIQINIIKMIVDNYEFKNKTIIGICLGCQIIGLAFDYKIIKMPQKIIGFNKLNLNSINPKYINFINYNIIANSISHHDDCIEWNDSNRLDLIATSFNKVPYIVAHPQLKIYGFQAHPELCYSSVECILKSYYDECIAEQLMIKYDFTINKYFVDKFLI